MGERPRRAHVFDDAQASTRAQQAPRFLIEGVLVSRVAHAFNCPDDVEARRDKGRRRVILLRKMRQVGYLLFGREAPSAFNLAGNRRDADNLGGESLCQPDRAATDAAARVENARALANADLCGQDCVQPVERLSMIARALVPIAEMDGVVGRVEPEDAIVSPGFVVVLANGGEILDSHASRVMPPPCPQRPRGKEKRPAGGPAASKPLTA